MFLTWGTCNPQGDAAVWYWCSSVTSQLMRISRSNFAEDLSSYKYITQEGFQVTSYRTRAVWDICYQDDTATKTWLRHDMLENRKSDYYLTKDLIYFLLMFPILSSAQVSACLSLQNWGEALDHIPQWLLDRCSVLSVPAHCGATLEDSIHTVHT